MQEVFRFALDRELKIAIFEPIGNALLECWQQIVHCPNFHNPLDLLSREQTQLHGGNDSKQAVPAVYQAK